MDIGLLRAIFNVGLRSSARVVERSARNVITMDILHTNMKTKLVSGLTLTGHLTMNYTKLE